MRGPSPELRVIFSEEFRRQLRRRSFTVFTVVMAALMLAAIPLTSLIVNLVEGSASDQAAEVAENPLATVGYVDAQHVLAGPGSQGSPKLYPDRANGTEAVLKGEIDTLFVLSDGYRESGGVEEYQVSGEGRLPWGTPAEWAFEGFLRYNLVAGQLDDDTLARAVAPAFYQRFEVEDDGRISEEVTLTREIGNLIVPILFAGLLMTAVLTGSGALLRSVAEEKETRMIEMLVTRASPLSIMTGKLLALWSAGMIQIGVWVTVGAVAMPAVFHRIPGGRELTITPGQLAMVALCFVLGYLLLSVLALFIAALVNSTEASQQYMGLLSMLIGLPLYMIGLFLSQPDGAIAHILTWFPFSTPTMLMVRLGTGSVMTGGEVTAALLMVAATALLLLWITARVFRAGILMAGQRITPGNVWAALRNAE